jgi:hypothetical protein
MATRKRTARPPQPPYPADPAEVCGPCIVGRHDRCRGVVLHWNAETPCQCPHGRPPAAPAPEPAPERAELLPLPRRVSIAQAQRVLPLVGQLTRTSPRHYLHANPDTGTVHLVYLGPNDRVSCTCPAVLKGRRVCYAALAAREQARRERAATRRAAREVVPLP